MLIAYRDQPLQADYVNLIAPVTTNRDEGDQLCDWPSRPGFTGPKSFHGLGIQVFGYRFLLVQFQSRPPRQYQAPVK
jgi:hypothetical protein